MSDSFDAILNLSKFNRFNFLELLVCNGGDFREMHTTKINAVANTSAQSSFVLDQQQYSNVITMCTTYMH